MNKESTSIRRIDYDEDNRKLTITFAFDGRMYEYKEVPEYVYSDFINAPSLGKFFQSYIKGKYDFVKIK